MSNMNNSAILIWLVVLEFMLILNVYSVKSGSNFNDISGLEPGNYCKESDATCTNLVEFFIKTSNELSLKHQYFDQCASDGNKSTTEIFEKLLTGEVIWRSGFNISFLNSEDCKLICTKRYNSNDLFNNMQLFDVNQGLVFNYHYQFIVDDKLVTWCYGSKQESQYCKNGFPIGCYVPPTLNHTNNLCATILGVSPQLLKLNTYYLFNHLEFTIIYNSIENENRAISSNTEVGRIQAVKFIPRSIEHKYSVNVSRCDSPKVFVNISPDSTKELNLTYSYSVKFLINKTVTRLTSEDNSPTATYTLAKLFMLFNLLTILISLIIFSFIFVHGGVCKPHHSDNNQKEEDRNEYNDNLFEFSREGTFLSIFTGSSIQVLCLFLVTLLLGFVSYITSTNPRTLKTFWLIVLYCFGIPTGYISSRIYKRIGGKKWITNIILTSIVCPGTAICLFSMTVIMNHTDNGKTVFPFSTLLEILLIWLFISVPFVFLGAFIGICRNLTENQRLVMNPQETLNNPSFLIYLFYEALNNSLEPFIKRINH